MSSIKKEFVLEGLNCAHCASKIEEGTCQIDGVSAASLNFPTKTLVVESDHSEMLNAIIAETKTLIKKIEPHVIVNEKSNVHLIDIEQVKDDEGLSSKGIFNHKTIALVQFGLGTLLFLVAVLFKFSITLEFSLFFISYILIGGEVLIKAIRNLINGQLFDENFLMSVATIGAFAIKEFPEGVAVMLFYQVGEFFQERAVNRSRRSITALMNIRPDFAHLKNGLEFIRVSPDVVKVGDTILIKPGEKVPLDGRIIEGFSTLDISALTGESMPLEVQEGDEILSGSINKNGLLTVQVTKVFGESTVSKILDLVQYAGSKKAPTENFITKFAKYYTPIVVFSALALAIMPPILLPGTSFSEWMHRALVFLVVSCPCALVISIPLSFFGGIGGASQQGILIKGSNYLEALNNVHTVVFDKTGTLTKGIFTVTEIVNQAHLSASELLEYGAFAESHSNHPIALSIMKAYGKPVDQNILENYNEIPGHGIKVSIHGKNLLVGNTRLMEQENISYEQTEALGTIIHIAIDGIYGGYLVISDEIKQDSKQAISALRDLGVKHLVMLTGDRSAVGEKIGKALELDQVFSELLPDQKVEKLEMLEKEKNSKGKLIFVGDGINDAPVLARADVGVAMGGLGSDAAIEAADVVLMNDAPYKLVTAIKIAKRTRYIVWQNIIFALSIKGIVLLLGAGGIATIWEAVFADVGVAVIAILNAMRVMKVKNL